MDLYFPARHVGRQTCFTLLHSQHYFPIVGYKHLQLFIHFSLTIVKFADDTLVVDLISNNNETYFEEIKNLDNWCQQNNLLQYVSKTKEVIVDFSKKSPLKWRKWTVSSTLVFTSCRIICSCHINTMEKKACQCLYQLERLRVFKLPFKVLSKPPDRKYHSMV